jgi:hypothetical protein
MLLNEEPRVAHAAGTLASPWSAAPEGAATVAAVSKGQHFFHFFRDPMAAFVARQSEHFLPLMLAHVGHAAVLACLCTALDQLATHAPLARYRTAAYQTFMSNFSLACEQLEPQPLVVMRLLAKACLLGLDADFAHRHLDRRVAPRVCAVLADPNLGLSDKGSWLATRGCAPVLIVACLLAR